MSDWRDVMNARAESDNYARDAKATDLTTNDPGICFALEALRLELRALSVLIDHARGDAK